MAVKMSRQVEARKQNKDLIRGSAISEMAINPTRVDSVVPHKERFEITHETRKQNKVKART